jgi:hypothetical protein
MIALDGLLALEWLNFFEIVYENWVFTSQEIIMSHLQTQQVNAI